MYNDKRNGMKDTLWLDCGLGIIYLILFNRDCGTINMGEEK